MGYQAKNGYIPIQYAHNRCAIFAWPSDNNVKENCEGVYGGYQCREIFLRCALRIVTNC